jgi:hypothetical protein
MSAETNPQGTLAATSGVLIGTGMTLVATNTGTTQILGGTFVLTGALLAVIRAWLRQP